MDSIAEQKRQLRREIRDRIRRISPAQRQRDAHLLCAQVQAQTAWQSARNILLFMPLSDEPDIYLLLQEVLSQGKTLCLPRFNKIKHEYETCQISDLERDLAPGAYGISEPLAICPIFPSFRLDLALVPGVAFDEMGHRLGRGKGFYDRLLIPASGLKWGVAFEEQIVKKVPTEAHDYKLDCILTPARCWFAGHTPV